MTVSRESAEKGFMAGECQPFSRSEKNTIWRNKTVNGCTLLYTFVA